jgi:predicted regulator of Ras-like GTPase activity (Roadblock/LC7/MglB family)
MEIDKSLNNLFELEGVRGIFVIDPRGTVVRARAHAIYDQETLQKAASSVSKALDSLQVQHGEWNAIQTQFSDGKLLLRSLKQYVLAVIADHTTNVAFANVALNVATKKIGQIIEARPLESAPAASSPSPMGVASMNESGLSVSSLGMSSGFGMPSGSQPAIQVGDDVKPFIARCAKALAKSVGPLAKVHVKDAVRSLARDGRFAREQIGPLVKALEGMIDNAEERQEFRDRLGM